MKEIFAVEPREQDIVLPGGRFHYLSWGAERAELPAAVLVHGITSSARSWTRVGPALAGRYRVFAFDMRGHGDSVHPEPGTYTLQQTASDTASFIKELKLERPLLLGHSWGGATALMLASGAWSEEPAPALERLILEDPACNFKHDDPEKAASAFVADIGRSPDELRPELTASNAGWSAADIEGKIDALQKVTRAAVISVFRDAGQEGDLLPLLARLTVPTLLIRADANLGTTLNETAWERARQFLPASGRAVEIPGATHNIHRNKFPEFMQVVNDFLAQG